MMTILLFLSTYFATNASVCLGTKCSGEKISIDYLEKNPTVSSTQEGYTVQSFIVSFLGDGVIYDKAVKGNSLEATLPMMKKNWHPGKKIYFDKVVLTNDKGNTIEGSGVFISE